MDVEALVTAEVGWTAWSSDEWKLVSASSSVAWVVGVGVGLGVESGMGPDVGVEMELAASSAGRVGGAAWSSVAWPLPSSS